MHPGCALGAEDESARLPTTVGRISAISWAMKLPRENPRISTWSNSIAATNAMASCAICATVLGVVPVEPPTTTFVEGNDPPSRYQRVNQRWISVVQIAAEMLEEDYRHRTVAELTIRVVDAIRSADHPVRSWPPVCRQLSALRCERPLVRQFAPEQCRAMTPRTPMCRTIR